MLNAQEYEPGCWRLDDAHGQPVALITLIRRGSEVGYRVAAWAQDSADQRVIGYYRNLRAASMAAHQTMIIRTASPDRPANG